MISIGKLFFSFPRHDMINNKVIKMKASNYSCPNCGANITYSIIHKKWHCKYCDSFLNVDELLEEKKKQESKIHQHIIKTKYAIVIIVEQKLSVLILLLLLIVVIVVVPLF